jgi:hypothetical protein
LNTAMAEIEIHHETGHEPDDFGRNIGVVAAIIGVFLAVVTIQSHRAHTEAVILKADANDKWAYYQSKSVKRSEYAIAVEMAKLTGAPPEKLEKAVTKFEKEKERYDKETEEIQAEARHVEEETQMEERKALRYDLGEGLLELGLVLSSLYFISKKRLFPYIGIFSAVLGTVVGATGLFLH